MVEPSLKPFAYVLAVHDLEGTADYLRDALGFEQEWRDGNQWRAMKRGEARIHLGHCPDALAPSELGDHGYFGLLVTDDVDQLHSEISARGAVVLSPPTTKAWGLREMAVATPEGHRIMFAQAI